MKRLIAVLLVMGVIMTAFAATGTVGNKEISSISRLAADTEVVVKLDQNIGVIWFSTSSNNNVSRYNLTLPTEENLSQSISGNDDWVASGSELFLNWNIISKDSVKVSLQISSPMVGDSASNTDKLGWTVSWYPTTTLEPLEGDATSISIASTASTASTDSDAVKGIAYTKNGTIYGNASQKQLWIYTENTFGKNADTYRAVLKATVETI